jgi:hypothetical protein
MPSNEKLEKVAALSRGLVPRTHVASPGFSWSQGLFYIYKDPKPASIYQFLSIMRNVVYLLPVLVAPTFF